MDHSVFGLENSRIWLQFHYQGSRFRNQIKFEAYLKEADLIIQVKKKKVILKELAYLKPDRN